ncbi:MAG: hypothetical protein SPK72_00415 [Bacteroidales bacterium]|jgi:hypothetical protein|nr:hypothetical protein [Bacteroidales bacterium]
MRIKLAIGLIVLLPLLSCNSSNNGGDNRAVASVYGKYLYQSDLQSVLYEGISPADSLVRTKAFIDEWIRRQLILHQAETTLDESELDFSKQLEEYRNSLVIYKYEAIMLEQNLDTNVSEEDIAKYIQRNSPKHELDDETVRYIILNMRRKALIEKMHNSLYNKAMKERVFVIY